MTHTERAEKLLQKIEDCLFEVGRKHRCECNPILAEALQDVENEATNYEKYCDLIRNQKQHIEDLKAKLLTIENEALENASEEVVELRRKLVRFDELEASNVVWEKRAKNAEALKKAYRQDKKDLEAKLVTIKNEAYEKAAEVAETYPDNPAGAIRHQITKVDQTEHEDHEKTR